MHLLYDYFAENSEQFAMPRVRPTHRRLSSWLVWMFLTSLPTLGCVSTPSSELSFWRTASQMSRKKKHFTTHSEWKKQVSRYSLLPWGNTCRGFPRSSAWQVPPTPTCTALKTWIASTKSSNWSPAGVVWGSNSTRPGSAACLWTSRDTRTQLCNRAQKRVSGWAGILVVNCVIWLSSMSLNEQRY